MEFEREVETRAVDEYISVLEIIGVDSSIESFRKYPTLSLQFNI